MTESQDQTWKAYCLRHRTDHPYLGPGQYQGTPYEEGVLSFVSRAGRDGGRGSAGPVPEKQRAVQPLQRTEEGTVLRRGGFLSEEGPVCVRNKTDRSRIEEVITRPLYLNNRFVGFRPAGTEEGVRFTVETEDGTRYEIETESGFVCEKGDFLLIEIGYEDGKPTDIARLKEKQEEHTDQIIGIQPAFGRMPDKTIPADVA